MIYFNIQMFCLAILVFYNLEVSSGNGVVLNISKNMVFENFRCIGYTKKLFNISGKSTSSIRLSAIGEKLNANDFELSSDVDSKNIIQ